MFKIFIIFISFFYKSLSVEIYPTTFSHREAVQNLQAYQKNAGSLKYGEVYYYIVQCLKFLDHIII